MITSGQIGRRLVMVSVISLACSAGAYAQPAPQQDVVLPRLEIGASVTFSETSPGRDRSSWTGPGLALGIAGNITHGIAAAATIERFRGRASTVLGGAQFSTDFFYGSGRDPVPGRFFGKVMAGSSLVGATRGAPAVHLGAGADLLLSRTLPIAVRGEVGYRLLLRDAPHRVGGTAAIGLLFGPHVSHRPGAGRRPRV